MIDHTINERLVWFGRAGVAEHDRSTVPWSIETGFNVNAVFAPHNTLGLALAYVDLNGQLQAHGNPPGLRHEIIAESTLTVPVNEQITLQPDLQYIIDPGGTASARNALVVGVRMSLAFSP